MKCSAILLTLFLLSACTINSPVSKYPVPLRSDNSSITQLAKSDFDRMADMEMEANTQSLRSLMIKLYKRNPNELKKSNSDNAETMTNSVFDQAKQHHWRFKQLQNKQDIEAIFLAFKSDYNDDRVLAFIVGMQTMIATAHNNKTDFYMTDELDPQKIYNVARNIEIAAWKLSNSRDENGQLFLLTNEINETNRNLSFEREFGKMIGRTDFYAIALAEKSQRLISRIAQGIASAVFLPF